MTALGCTHTSDWWKQMIPCVCCGAMYNDEEAKRIAYETANPGRCFSQEQLDYIRRQEEDAQ
jgi:hypothetical protein